MTDELLSKYEIIEPYILNSYNYLPKLFENNQVIRLSMDALNALISTEDDPFKKIRSAYFDTLYKPNSYDMLSYEAKLNILHELGFDYLIDIIDASLGDQINEQNKNSTITQLIGFFELIYSLKGKREGLDIIFNILNLDYTYTTWDETSPKGEPFTATLKITATTGNLDENNNSTGEINIDYNKITTSDEVYTKLSNFVRSYMLPWISVTIEGVCKGGSLYFQPITAYIDGIKQGMVNGVYPQAARTTIPISGYDVNEYDSSNSLYDTDPTSIPEIIFEDVSFKIICNKTSATILINNEETDEVIIPKFTRVFYSVTYNDQTKSGYIVVNTNREINITF